MIFIAAADNAIRAAAANAGLSNDIITAGLNAQGAAYNQALTDGKSAQERCCNGWGRNNTSFRSLQLQNMILM